METNNQWKSRHIKMVAAELLNLSASPAEYNATYVIYKHVCITNCKHHHDTCHHQLNIASDAH